MAGPVDTPDRRVSDDPNVEECDNEIDADTALDADEVSEPAAPPSRRRMALVVGLLIVVALGCLVGWQGWRVHQAGSDQAQREAYIATARQGALNLTTIDWEHADRDVQRVLDSATGAFRDDFAQRSQPFIDVVKKAQSKSEGTVTESALESQSPGSAQVLVVARVDITNAGAVEQEPRRWRMRMSVQRTDGEMKISQVAFVP